MNVFHHDQNQTRQLDMVCGSERSNVTTYHIEVAINQYDEIH